MGCANTKDSRAVTSPQPGSPSATASNQQEQKKHAPAAADMKKEFTVSHGDFVKLKTTPFKNEYIMKDRLGEGGFGEVRKVVHKATNFVRAAKIIKKESVDPEERAKMVQEIEILTSLDHPNIMKVFEMYEESDKYYIVSEYLEGGELFDKLAKQKNFSEKDAAKVMKQLLSAVSYSHQHGIVHRDLKPENMVFETTDANSTLKVIDFGTAGHFKKDQQLEEPYGTAYYIAPEMLTSTYNEKCDVWSCGVILYILLSGTPPYTGKTDEAILEQVVEGKYDLTDLKHWGKISDEAKSFIRKMMEIKPEMRYSAEQALADPWIKLAETGDGNFNHPLASENLTSLKSFGFKMKLQETAWMFLVSYFSSAEEKKKLLETFKAIDVNHDGQLTKEELKQGYVKVMKMSDAAAEEEADRVINSVDANQSGKIDYSEFVSATISKKTLLDIDKLEAAFKLMDKDGNGKITPDELRFMFNDGKACKIPPETWQGWIAQADKNADGAISTEEFKQMMISIISSA